MAIAIESTFQGSSATLDKYDLSVQKLGGTPGGPYPNPACLFHWAAPIPGGFKITYVFTTRQAWDDWVEAKLAAVRQEVGLPEPHHDFFDIHAFMTAGS
jgi:hypothetical protein